MRSSFENIKNTGRTMTTGGVIRSAKNPKNRCLSPRKEYLEKAYAEIKAMGTVMRMFKVTYVTELRIDAVKAGL